MHSAILYSTQPCAHMLTHTWSWAHCKLFVLSGLLVPGRSCFDAPLITLSTATLVHETRCSCSIGIILATVRQNTHYLLYSRLGSFVGFDRQLGGHGGWLRSCCFGMQRKLRLSWQARHWREQASNDRPPAPRLGSLLCWRFLRFSPFIFTFQLPTS